MLPGNIAFRRTAPPKSGHMPGAITGMRTSRQKWWLLAAAALLGAALLGFQVKHRQDQAAVLRSDPEDILSDPALRGTAIAYGRAVYQQHCSACHRADGTGDRSLGVPDLTGAQHLYGEGRVAEIEDIARHGIRSADKRGLRLASMPAFGSLHPYKGEPLPSLTPGQIEDVTQYVLALNGRATDPDAAAKGGALYQGGAGCYDCHGRNAEGDSSVGAPSLVDGPRLYGDGSHDDIYRSLVAGRAGVSPAFGKLLTAAELRNVAVYIASLQKAHTEHADAR